MKKNISKILLVFALGVLTQPISAQRSDVFKKRPPVPKTSAEVKPLSTWEGVWDDSSEKATIFITEKDGFIDLMGKDSTTVFTCTGVIAQTTEGSFAECYGNGRVANQRFVYKSRLNLKIEQRRGESADLNIIWEYKVLEETRDIIFAGGRKATRKLKYTVTNTDR